MSKWKKLLLSSMAVGSLSFLAACSGGEVGNTDKPATGDGADTTEVKDGESALGVSFYEYADTYISSVRQALEAEGKGGDSKLLLNDAQNDQANQNDQLDVMIQQGVNGLAVNIVDVGAVQTVLDKAESKDLPILFFNREPDQEILKSYDKARFVGTTPEEAGIMQGEMALELWESDPKFDKNGDGVMNYVMLTRDADNSEAIARIEYEVKTMKDIGGVVAEMGQQ